MPREPLPTFDKVILGGFLAFVLMSLPVLAGMGYHAWRGFPRVQVNVSEAAPCGPVSPLPTVPRP
jgi:hypothetical protein